MSINLMTNRDLDGTLLHVYLQKIMSSIIKTYVALIIGDVFRLKHENKDTHVVCGRGTL